MALSRSSSAFSPVASAACCNMRSASSRLCLICSTNSSSLARISFSFIAMLLVECSAPKRPGGICKPRTRNDTIRRNAARRTGRSGVFLTCAKYSVARVAQTRHDIPMLIEMTVDGCRINMDVGMTFFNGADAFGCRHEHQGAHFSATCLLQQIDGRHHGTPGGEHGVNDERQALFELAHQP